MCRNECGKETKPPNRTFCSKECVHEYKIKSDLSYMRKAMFTRDKGICASCGADCELLRLELALMRHVDYNKYKETLLVMGIRPDARKTYWDADHIIPVSKGGGECGLDNLRSLCIPCHKKVTKALKKNNPSEEPE